MSDPVLVEATAVPCAEPEIPLAKVLPISRLPRTRGECAGGARPCPWISCAHHMVWASLSRRVRGPDIINDPSGKATTRRELLLEETVEHLEDLPETCTLDVADRGATQQEIGDLLGVTKQAAFLIETKALRKLSWRSMHLREGPGGGSLPTRQHRITEETAMHTHDAPAAESHTPEEGAGSPRRQSARCQVHGCKSPPAPMHPVGHARRRDEALAGLCCTHVIRAHGRVSRGTPLAEAVAGVIACDRGRMGDHLRGPRKTRAEAPVKRRKATARKTAPRSRSRPAAPTSTPQDPLARVAALVRRAGGLAALERIVEAWESLLAEAAR